MTTRRSLFAAGVLAVALTLASACSSSSPTSVQGEMSLSSKSSILTKVGPDDSKTYGWNQLVGTTSTQIGDFAVEMLGNVDYDQGTGPFFGFLTLTAANGDHLAMRMDGSAKVLSDGSTALSSRLTVIDGSGEFVGASGHGSFTGSRLAQVGAPIEITMTLGLSD